MSENITLAIPAGSRIDNGETLLATLLKNESALQTMLGNYYYSKRGKVHGVRIDEHSVVFTDEQNGKFCVIYNVNFTQGCQDLTYDENAKMVITFHIDHVYHKLALYGETVREREPDEI